MGLMWYWECDALDMLFSVVRHSQYHADHHHLLTRNFAVAGLVSDDFFRRVAPDLCRVVPSWYETRKTRATRNTTTPTESHVHERAHALQAQAQAQAHPLFAITPRHSDADRYHAG